MDLWGFMKVDVQVVLHVQFSDTVMIAICEILLFKQKTDFPKVLELESKFCSSSRYTNIAGYHKYSVTGLPILFDFFFNRMEHANYVCSVSQRSTVLTVSPGLSYYYGIFLNSCLSHFRSSCSGLFHTPLLSWFWSFTVNLTPLPLLFTFVSLCFLASLS